MSNIISLILRLRLHLRQAVTVEMMIPSYLSIYVDIGLEMEHSSWLMQRLQHINTRFHLQLMIMWKHFQRNSMTASIGIVSCDVLIQLPYFQFAYIIIQFLPPVSILFENH